MTLSNSLDNSRSDYEDMSVCSVSDYITDNIFWFHTDSKYGKLIIGIFRNSTYDQSNNFYKHTIIEMVKTINREEEIIRLIEDWLEVGLNLRPFTKQNNEDNYITLKVDKQYSDKSHGKIIIAFSNEILNLLPYPDELVKRNITIETSLTNVSLSLSSNTLSTQCVEELKPGYILLVPESFSTEWLTIINKSNILPNDLNCKIGNDIRTLSINNTQTNTINNRDQADITKNDKYLTIIVDNEIQLPLDMVLGWKKEADYLLSKSLTNYKIDIKNNSKLVATGHLLKITSGYGVFIDSKLE
ncbi:MAG: hypothetical protein ABW104_04145 [Candidatus Thiodiazotropha sp. 6PLUC2]